MHEHTMRQPERAAEVLAEVLKKEKQGYIIGVIGGTGAGKTTFCNFLKQFNIEVLHLGFQIRQSFSAGKVSAQMAPKETEEFVRDIIGNAITWAAGAPLVIDGFPRSVEQAEWVKTLEVRGLAAVLIHSPVSLREERIKKRATPWDETLAKERFKHEESELKPVFLHLTLNYHCWEVINGTV